MTNPLLQPYELPPFSQLQPEHIEPAIDQVLAENRSAIKALIERHRGAYTFENLVAPLEEIEDRLSRTWSPVRHLNAVTNTEVLRAAYNACLPKLSEYGTEVSQNLALFEAYVSISQSPAYQTLTTAQKKMVDNAVRDFNLSGVTLSEEKKNRYKEISQDLSRLTSKFDENLLDATTAWERHLTDESALAGLPPSAVAMAKQAAAQRGKEGFLLTLEPPSYLATMTYANDRGLRRDVYEAYVTRASDQGPHAGQWDNSKNIQDIVALRHEMSQLLGFDNYAQRSLATKMATSTSQVIEFLQNLADRSLPMAQRDFAELSGFAKDTAGISPLESWDVAYFSEKLRQKNYALSQEDVKPYFPENRALQGLFEVVRRLYGLSFKERKDVDTWHKDVRFFEVFDDKNEQRGSFFIDLYARQKKRGGAWMDSCIDRKQLAAAGARPVAFLTCNFTPPVGDEPALFTHNEVLTLFHEFGHGLHHMLTRVDYPSVAGTSGVAWDAVELPSQFMENWCWEREALDFIAKHVKTNEPLPDELLQKMQAAKNFQSGMAMVRQLEFGLFDFLLHAEFDPAKGADTLGLIERVRAKVAVVKPPSFNRFSHGFSHIFAGGYAAGYYSYKWAEVLSSDAFAAFEEKGIFDQETGQRFMKSVLEQGGTRDAMDLFIEFRGRPPQIDALLRHNGMQAHRA
jgi:oligopeptidase A